MAFNMMKKTFNPSTRYQVAGQPVQDENAMGGLQGGKKREALAVLKESTNTRPAIDSTNAVSKKPTVLPPSIQVVQPDVNEAEMKTEDDEVSERAYMQRGSDDIDERDAGNPILATTYVNEMYDNFNAMEKQYAVNPSFMTGQPFVNERMRAILIDWLVSILSIPFKNFFNELSRLDNRLKCT